MCGQSASLAEYRIIGNMYNHLHVMKVELNPFSHLRCVKVSLLVILILLLCMTLIFHITMFSSTVLYGTFVYKARVKLRIILKWVFN
jgi:hypothetical protein